MPGLFRAPFSRGRPSGRPGMPELRTVLPDRRRNPDPAGVSRHSPQLMGMRVEERVDHPVGDGGREKYGCGQKDEHRSPAQSGVLWLI